MASSKFEDYIKTLPNTKRHEGEYGYIIAINEIEEFQAIVYKLNALHNALYYPLNWFAFWIVLINGYMLMYCGKFYKFVLNSDVDDDMIDMIIKDSSITHRQYLSNADRVVKFNYIRQFSVPNDAPPMFYKELEDLLNAVYTITMKSNDDEFVLQIMHFIAFTICTYFFDDSMLQYENVDNSIIPVEQLDIMNRFEEGLILEDDVNGIQRRILSEKKCDIIMKAWRRLLPFIGMRIIDHSRALIDALALCVLVQLGFMQVKNDADDNNTMRFFRIVERLPLDIITGVMYEAAVKYAPKNSIIRLAHVSGGDILQASNYLLFRLAEEEGRYYFTAAGFQYTQLPASAYPPENIPRIPITSSLFAHEPNAIPIIQQQYPAYPPPQYYYPPPQGYYPPPQLYHQPQPSSNYVPSISKPTVIWMDTNMGEDFPEQWARLESEFRQLGYDTREFNSSVLPKDIKAPAIIIQAPSPMENPSSNRKDQTPLSKKYRKSIPIIYIQRTKGQHYLAEEMRTERYGWCYVDWYAFNEKQLAKKILSKWESKLPESLDDQMTTQFSAEYQKKVDAMAKYQIVFESPSGITRKWIVPIFQLAISGIKLYGSMKPNDDEGGNDMYGKIDATWAMAASKMPPKGWRRAAVCYPSADNFEQLMSYKPDIPNCDRICRLVNRSDLKKWGYDTNQKIAELTKMGVFAVSLTELRPREVQQGLITYLYSS